MTHRRAFDQRSAPEIARTTGLYERRLKRLLDLVLCALGLVVLSPVFAVVALAIWVEDRGPVLFRQKRVGKDGALFELAKFRSMTTDTDDVPKAAAGTLQVTRVGRFIRRLNVDELPQLVTIIKGDMSLVGPRPPLASQEQLCRLRVERGADGCLPGLTGLAQVNGYDGMPDDEKSAWDAQYASHITFATDVRILLRTFRYLCRRPPVY